MRSKFMKKCNIIVMICLILSATLMSCAGGNNVKFIEKDGHKQYKKESGELAQAEWVTINGNDYYFDMNGYLKTNEWIEDEYYVDSNGKKLVKAWHKDDDKTYYLSSSGKYLRGTTATIDGKDYYFDKDGTLVKEKFFYNEDGKYLHASSTGAIDKPNGLIDIADRTYFIDEHGVMHKGWKEINGVYYYFENDGAMAKNMWIDATYYVDESGKMLKNATSPEGYEIDKEGKVLEKYKRKILANDFKYLFLSYCDAKWAECGSDGSYISIDTNPGDYDNSKNSYLSTMYLKEALKATETILKELGFPDYVYKKIGQTSSRDGTQTETLGDITVSWKYHPDTGAEILIIKKEKQE